MSQQIQQQMQTVIATVVYSDSETLSENDKPYFIDHMDASSDDNNGVFN